MPMTHRRPPLGRHFLLDIAEAPFDLLDDPVEIEEALVATVRTMGAKVLGIHVHRLAPQGISGVVVISESHLTIHTWPELGEAAVDLFTCGDVARARTAVDALARALGAAKAVVEERVRGVGAG